MCKILQIQSLAKRSQTVLSNAIDKHTQNCSAIWTAIYTEAVVRDLAIGMEQCADLVQFGILTCLY